jgi:hypothetical protein
MARKGLGDIYSFNKTRAPTGFDSTIQHLAECGYHTAEIREKCHPCGCVHRKLEDMPDEGRRSK